MRDRLVTAAGALGALLCVYLLFGQRPTEPPVTRPLSTEAGRHGYLGLRTWLERAGVRVTSLQERYDKLRDPELGLAPSGNVLITTMPYYTPLRRDETGDIAAWTSEGNTLLVLAALNDTPEWSSVSETMTFLRDLQLLTGMRFTPFRDDDEDERRRPNEPWLPAGSVIELEGFGTHPLTRGVFELRGFSDGPTELWWPAERPRGPVLRLAVESSTGLDALWQLPRSAGQVLLVASGTVLTNDNIATADAPTFVANLVRHHLAPGGTVIFDDMHQGLSKLYDAAAFFRDSRLHATIWFVLAAWLVWVLGSSNRLAPPQPALAEPRQSHFLAAAGGFMARRLDRRAAGLAMLDEWFDEVRRARGLAQSAEPPWDEVAATPALGRATYEALRDYHDRLTTGRTVSLVRLHNTLQRAREAIG